MRAGDADDPTGGELVLERELLALGLRVDGLTLMVRMIVGLLAANGGLNVLDLLLA